MFTSFLHRVSHNFQNVEPFLKNCSTVERFLSTVIQHISDLDCLPCSAVTIRQLIALYKQSVDDVLNHPLLNALRNEGKAILSSLSGYQAIFQHSPDYR